MEETKTVSFVIPCYRSERTIEGVVREIRQSMERDYPSCGLEIILVNDGSPDGTWDRIRAICGGDDRVKGICLSRNFGQHAALMAGLAASAGEYVVCLDDDGQTPADEAHKLIRALDEGADVAYARYRNKKHSVFRNFGTAMNEWMASVMLGKPEGLYVSSYFAARRFVVDEMLRYTGSYPYVIGLVLRATHNIVNVDVTHRRREAGSSGYTFTKLISLWVNGFTSFSIKPLRIATMMGGILAFVGFAYGIYTVVKKLMYPDLPTVGFSALMSAVVFMDGMLMLMVGMAGEYIGRIYISQNNNPQYVIREVAGMDRKGRTAPKAGEHGL